jgi:AAA ATPase domain
MSNHFSAAIPKLPGGAPRLDLTDPFVLASPESAQPDAIGTPTAQAPSELRIDSQAAVAELSGRRSECALLDGLIAAVRRGESRALVLRGEPGVGKTALLAYLVAAASDLTVIRSAGLESEMEFAFAGFQQLFGAWALARAEQLAAPQRNALRRAFGLIDGPAPEVFLVGLAALSLLSQMAEECPVVCLVDDMQWLDREPVSVLSFVARRLAAEPIAMLFSVRDPSPEQELDGLPDLALTGLGDSDARQLLETAIPGGLDEQVRERIVAETRGNPLAPLELPRGLTPAELAGGFGLPDARELSGRIERSFLRRVQSLPRRARRRKSPA